MLGASHSIKLLASLVLCVTGVSQLVFGLIAVCVAVIELAALIQAPFWKFRARSLLKFGIMLLVFGAICIGAFIVLGVK